MVTRITQAPVTWARPSANSDNARTQPHVSGSSANISDSYEGVRGHGANRLLGTDIRNNNQSNEASKYWSDPRREFDVDIDGHDFDFKPRQQLSGNRAKGFIDGPFSHNGRFEILENSGNSFKMSAQFGTNDDQDNDMKVVLHVKNGTASVTGTAKGKAIPDGTTAPVSGSGTQNNPFRLEFKDQENKKHTLLWRSE